MRSGFIRRVHLKQHSLPVQTSILQDFRADEWLLAVMESPRMVHSRGFATGRIYKRDGTLVASVAQVWNLNVVHDKVTTVWTHMHCLCPQEGVIRFRDGSFDASDARYAALEPAVPRPPTRVARPLSPPLPHPSQLHDQARPGGIVAAWSLPVTPSQQTQASQVANQMTSGGSTKARL